MNILKQDEDLSLCANSFIAIDDQVTLGNGIYNDGDTKEGFFTMFDALKHIGDLTESCLKTYDEFVEDTVDYATRV